MCRRSSSPNFLPVPTASTTRHESPGGIADLLRDVRLLPFDEACAERFGRIRGQSLRSGLSFST
ncbi:MAG: hypothetical protein M3552_22170, partial [Planctomycetota bacterium]|nr:hypothetical protein [Planctomycetota bacterium]